MARPKIETGEFTKLIKLLMGQTRQTEADLILVGKLAELKRLSRPLREQAPVEDEPDL